MPFPTRSLPCVKPLSSAGLHFPTRTTGNAPFLVNLLNPVVVVFCIFLSSSLAMYCLQNENFMDENFNTEVRTRRRKVGVRGESDLNISS